MKPAAMEDSPQSLAIESFSYSWLINRRPSFECHDNDPFRPSLDCHSEDNITREKSHYFVASKRFLKEELAQAQSFNFDIPLSRSPSVLVHADEIFSNGRIMPLHVKKLNIEEPSDGSSASSAPVIPTCSVAPAPDKVFYHFLKKWRNSPKRILQKWFRFLRPLFNGMRCSRKSIRVDDFDCKVWKVQSLSASLQASPQSSDRDDITCIGSKFDAYRRLRKVRSWSNSPQASPQQSPSRFTSTNVWCDTESSIIEAVLHCKRSIEKREI